MSDPATITTGGADLAGDSPLATSAPGIPDEALLPGANLPEPPTDAEVARVARRLGAPVPPPE